MAKPEWGTKRICQNCAARFYDLLNAEIICPACGTSFDAEAVVRARRAKVGAVSKVTAAELEDDLEVDADVVEDEDDVLATEEPDDDDTVVAGGAGKADDGDGFEDDLLETEDDVDTDDAPFVEDAEEGDR